VLSARIEVTGRMLIYGTCGLFEPLPFSRWLRDEDVELARLTTAVLPRFLATPSGRESPDFTACPLLQPALAVR
jgi:hypothetical protein